ncbi:unnamed protein product [Rhizophagus irregularis]|nr:unnamed protein product [Rhizophagus irregularis]
MTLLITCKIIGNLPDLSEGGQQQHHQEEQSSQSLGEDPFISSLHQLRASLHNCFSYYKIIKSRNSRTKKRGITIV